MNKAPYFSIVMPAYNVEQYIESAVDSVRNQTFYDWELIIVDDCSPDASGRAAEKLKSQDSRITVVHHDVNKGVSQARNTGIEQASGEYIWFMDPDDRADVTLLKAVYESIKVNQPQLVVFGLQEEYFGKDGTFKYSHTIKPESHEFSASSELRPYMIQLEQETLYGYVWNKVYDLKYLKSLRLKYENASLNEDILFNVKFCMDISSMNTLSIAPYHYAKRLEENLTNKFVPEYFELHRKRIELILEQYKYWKLCTSELKRILGSLYARYILSAMQRNCDKQAEMNHVLRYRWCSKLFGESMFNELIPLAGARNSKVLSFWIFLLKRKNRMLCLLMGRAVYLIKNKLPVVYSKVKSGR